MSTTIGELLVKIIGSSTGLTSSIGAAEKQVKGLSNTTEAAAKGSGFQSIFQGVGLGVGLFAMNAVVGAIGDVTSTISDSIRVAEDDEAAMTKLNTALTDAGLAATGTSAAFQDARTSGVNLGFTIADLTNAQALLVTGTKSVADANTALKAAEDLARLKNIDLGTAVTAVTKAYNGSATALTKMGIVIPKGVSGLQALAAIEAQAGGQAQAFADTTAGSVDVLSAKFDELKGKVGTDLIPVFSNLVDAASGAADAVNGISDSVDVFTGKSTNNMGAIAEDTSAIDELAGSIIGQFVPGMGLVKGAADAASQAALDAQNKLNLTPDATRTAGKGFEDMAPVVTGAMSTVGTSVDTTMTNITTSVMDATGAITTQVTTAMGDVVSTVTKTPGDIASALTSGQGAVDSAMSTLSDSIKNPMSEAARMATLKGQLTTANYDLGLAEAAKDPVAIANAHAAIAVIEGQMQTLEDDASDYGLHTIEAYAQGLDSKAALAAVSRATGRVADTTSQNLRAFSPPRYGPLKDIDTWGENTGIAWADGLAKGLGTAGGALSGVGLGAPSMPGVSGAVMGSLGGGSPFAGATIVVQVGNEKLAEITDRQLAQQGRIYAPGIPSQTLGAPTR